MKEQLKKAGINTAAARLSRIASDAIERAKGNTAKALQSFRITVLTDAELIRELVGQDLVWEKAAAFLNEKRQSWAPSQNEVESHAAVDRRPNSVSSTSQVICESQLNHDRGELTRSSGASLSSNESHALVDRPVAPATRISRVAARSVASVFDERISTHFEMKYGDITQYDYLNLRITLAGGAVLNDRLSKIEWPAMHTPLRDFADAAEIAAIRDARDAAVARELSAVKGIQHGTA